MTKILLSISIIIAAALAATTSDAMPIAREAGVGASAPIILAANGCGGGRYRGPYGSCHRYGTGPYPGGYNGAYVHRFCWWGHGARHCTRR
jgi:hypothetical protein